MTIETSIFFDIIEQYANIKFKSGYKSSKLKWPKWQSLKYKVTHYYLWNFITTGFCPLLTPYDLIGQ